MLFNANQPVERAWNTWSSRPAEMVFLPLGIRVTPVAYADSLRQATTFPAGTGVRPRTHAVDGSLVELDLEHAGTRLAWRWHKASPFELVGSWVTQATGEWGLRFWINVCLSAESGEAVRWDPARRAALVKVGHRFVALASLDEPVQVTGHDAIEDLVSDYATRGYFSLATRAEEARVLALRFNLEMMRDGRFAVAVADDAELAVSRARTLLAAELRPADLPGQSGRAKGMLDALRDIVGWLTIWDPVNARPYTAISRNWDLTKFGGFGVWLDDQLYAALSCSLFDAGLARANLAVALSGATPQGNLPCLLTANDAWVDRTQIPVAAFLVWMLARRGGGAALLREAFPTLARNHAWWWEHRDPDNRGLASYGTSDVGEGLYKGTSFGARNESSMDNSPIHDEATYDPATRTLTTLDVGLNSMLALDAEMLALIALELGETEQARAFAHRAEETRRHIRSQLWDPSRGIFANRLRSGGFVRSVGPTSFYPLVAGAADEGQVESLLRHLADPDTFGGSIRIPSVSRDDPAYGDNVYWRGRVWPPLNWTIWHGLRRYGRFSEASALAADSEALFRTAWARALCPENYNAETGEPLDQPDTEPFYGWGALMPMMAVEEVMSVSPWYGWTVVNTGEDVTLGPVESEAGRVTLQVAGGELALARGGDLLLRTSLRGRITHLRLGPGGLSMRLPGGAGRIHVPGVTPKALLGATLDGRPLEAASEGEGLGLAIPEGTEGRLLAVAWAE